MARYFCYCVCTRIIWLLCVILFFVSCIFYKASAAETAEFAWHTELVNEYITLYGIMQTGSVIALREQSAVLIDVIQRIPDEQVRAILRPSVEYLLVMQRIQTYEDAQRIFPFIYTPMFQLQCPNENESCALHSNHSLFSLPHLEVPAQFSAPILTFIQAYNALRTAFYLADIDAINASCEAIQKSLLSINFPPLQTYIQKITSMAKSIEKNASLDKKLRVFEQYTPLVFQVLSTIRLLHF